MVLQSQAADRCGLQQDRRRSACFYHQTCPRQLSWSSPATRKPRPRSHRLGPRLSGSCTSASIVFPLVMGMRRPLRASASCTKQTLVFVFQSLSATATATTLIDRVRLAACSCV
ncbi:hypothetical protein CCHR01_12684 [Colletotrichum chrysophilum]|uniref:Uncharacterized protein n=1 Tax=Colletotrichum chrysophilum TaxID=1836956 RepID=A0AAD9AFR6_9PEZI|nr:hypothetical protein CCHR01_12684 [Colletotrichum chrysophilum]